MCTAPATRSSLVLCCLATFGLLLLDCPLQAGFAVDLDFGSSSALPSATGQGLVFQGSAGVGETDVFQVSGGVLKVDTRSFLSDVSGYYELSPGYDTALDSHLQFRAQVTNMTGVTGLVVGFSGMGGYGYVGVTPTGWHIVGSSASGSLAAGFHDYDLSVTGGTLAYVLKVDGVVVSTGTLPGTSPITSYFFIGDITPTGGNIRGEISSIHYSNNNDVSAVPEPSSLVLLGTGFLGLICRSRLRLSRR